MKITDAMYDEFEDPSKECKTDKFPKSKTDLKAEKQAALDSKAYWDACIDAKQMTGTKGIPKNVLDKQGEVHKRLQDVDKALGYKLPDDQRLRTQSGYAKGGKVKSFKGYGKAKKV